MHCKKDLVVASNGYYYSDLNFDLDNIIDKTEAIALSKSYSTKDGFENKNTQPIDTQFNTQTNLLKVLRLRSTNHSLIIFSQFFLII